ncbi:PEPxxWA-CTERM sorting domain-containing protein [Pseudoduganella umbonata]|uniref:Ice-binding protein C-terminal domain-containing protein n=2 Tax=Pseudoduganella umbonata TaxID=864828 RepID=A0A7W5HAG5_9BURK|nr:PEPxxWA-CTERM sorting domain-containing protein [Pseudoduganella umbonata]MBB3219534.1 hypothetical protein [Pseudoduganella umbonata]
MKKQLSILVFPLAAACLPAAALAAESFTQTSGLRNLQFGVIDLTPADSAAAGFTIEDVATRHWHSVTKWTIPSEGPYRTEDVSGTDPSAFETSFLSGRVATSADAISGNLALTTTVGREMDESFSAEGYIDQSWTLRLAPHSVLTLSGEVFRSAVLSNPGDTGFSANWSTLLSLTSGNSVTGQDFGLYNAPLEGTTTRPFWYAIANTTDVASTVAFSLSINNYSNAYQWTPSAVPEPATWGMLLAGLGLVAANRRRRA